MKSCKTPRIVRDIRALNNLAKDARMFNDKEKVGKYYKEKNRLILRYGKPKCIEVYGDSEVVSCNVYGSKFHVPVSYFDKEVVENLRKGNSYNHSRLQRY